MAKTIEEGYIYNAIASTVIFRANIFWIKKLQRIAILTVLEYN